MIRRGLLLTAAAAALLAGPATARHSWKSYHWNSTGTNVQYEVYTSLSQSYWRSMQLPNGTVVDIVQNAIDDWGNPASDPNPATQAQYRDYLQPVWMGDRNDINPTTCDPLVSRILVCSAAYGANGWLGIATIWLEGSHIVQGTTKLNDTYHQSGTYGSYSWRAAVACQEIGHDFGLGHQDENSFNDQTQSCMEYTNQPSGNETPDWHDFEQLQKIYDAHAQEGTGGGGGPGPPPGKGKKSNADPFTFREVGGPSPSQADAGSRGWGTAVGFDAHGRPNVFVLEIRQGFRKVTHVRWLPGFEPKPHHMGDHH